MADTTEYELFAEKWKAEIKKRKVTFREVLDDMPEDMFFGLGTEYGSSLIVVDSKAEYLKLKDVIFRGYERRTQSDFAKEDPDMTISIIPFEDREVLIIWKSTMNYQDEPEKLQIRIRGAENGLACFYWEYKTCVKQHYIDCDREGVKIGRCLSYSNSRNPKVV